MRKRKWVGVCGVAAVVIGAGLGLLAVVLRHEPNFYQQAQLEPGQGRRILANEFLGSFGQMILSRDHGAEDWGCTTSEAQWNSFLEEHFPGFGEGESLRRLGISDLVVTFEEDRARLAFRYGTGWFSTIVSYEIKFWLVPKEANTIAVEILSARAGAMPISSQSILHQLSDFGRKQNKRVTLYRHESNPVAVIGLQAEQDPHPKWLLTTVEIDPKTRSLVIQGKTPEHAMPPLELNKVKSAAAS